LAPRCHPRIYAACKLLDSFGLAWRKHHQRYRPVRRWSCRCC